MPTLNTTSFLKPGVDRIEARNWSLINEENLSEPMNWFLPYWEPGTSIHVTVDLIIDVEGLVKDCQLKRDAILQAVFRWESTDGTGLQGIGSSQYFRLDKVDDIIEKTLMVQIEGRNLSTSVTLEPQVVLAKRGSTESLFAPRLPGCILWRKPKRLVLEGVASLFPMELIDFTNIGRFHDHSGWYLEWSSAELNRNLLSDLRLFVNRSSERIRKAVTGDPEGEPAIRETILFDIARILITGALENEDFVMNPETYEEGSIGATIRRLLKLYFGDVGFSNLQTEYEANPIGFEHWLQDKVQVFRELD